MLIKKNAGVAMLISDKVDVKEGKKTKGEK